MASFREQLFFISFARTWAMNISPADAVSVMSISTRISIQSCNRFDVSGQILIRRTVIALKALSIIFRSSRKPLSAQSMPRQVLVQVHNTHSC